MLPSGETAPGEGLELYHDISEFQVSLLLQMSQHTGAEKYLTLSDTVQVSVQLQCLDLKYSKSWLIRSPRDLDNYFVITKVRIIRVLTSTVKLGYIKLGFYEYMVYIEVLSRTERNPIYFHVKLDCSVARNRKCIPRAP